MKLLGTLFALVMGSAISSGAMAESQNIPVTCTWKTISVSYVKPYTVTTSQCTNNQTLVATKVVKTGAWQLPQCSLTTAPGFFYTGTCQNPSFYQVVN